MFLLSGLEIKLLRFRESLQQDVVEYSFQVQGGWHRGSAEIWRKKKNITALSCGRICMHPNTQAKSCCCWSAEKPTQTSACSPSFYFALLLKLLWSADCAKGRQVVQSSCCSVSKSTNQASQHETLHHFSPLLDQPARHPFTLAFFFFTDLEFILTTILFNYVQMYTDRQGLTLKKE